MKNRMIKKVVTKGVYDENLVYDSTNIVTQFPDANRTNLLQAREYLAVNSGTEGGVGVSILKNQQQGEGDYLSITSDSIDFQGTFKHYNISESSSSPDTLISLSPIEDGDLLVIRKNDGSLIETVVNGVVFLNPEYQVDTTSITQGETPSKAFLNSPKVEFDFGSGFIEATRDTDIKEYWPVPTFFNPDVEMNMLQWWTTSGPVYDNDTYGNTGVIRIGERGISWNGSYGIAVTGLTPGEEYIVDITAKGGSWASEITSNMYVRDGSTVGVGTTLAIDYNSNTTNHSFETSFVATSSSVNVKVSANNGNHTDSMYWWRFWHVYSSKYDSYQEDEFVQVKRKYEDLISSGGRSLQTKVTLQTGPYQLKELTGSINSK